MLPPVVRRCPACGHLDLSPRFPATLEDGEWTVECPVCGHRFEPPEKPWLV